MYLELEAKHSGTVDVPIQRGTSTPPGGPDFPLINYNSLGAPKAQLQAGRGVLLECGASGAANV
jgi:hypothetical protein